MNRQEHLLVILSEECVEVAKCVSKALRFGVDHAQPDYEGETLANRERIWRELCDLMAAAIMLERESVLPSASIGSLPAYQRIEAKIKKVEQYLEYSKTLGTLR